MNPATYIAPMIRRRRRPFIICLFLTTAIAATLSFHNIVVRNIQQITKMLVHSPSAQTQTYINKTTLLEFAAIDSRKAMYKQETEQLLEATGSFDGASSSNSTKFDRYWREFRTNLQEWMSKRRFDSGIMMDLVTLIKHPIDRYNNLIDSYDHNNKRYNSCAVVGNSGILLNSDYGELIDSHEMVIRLNNATTGPKVGKKTSVSFTFSTTVHDCAKMEDCFCHPYSEKVPIIMYICKPIHFFDYILCNSSHKAPLMITDSRFDELCARIAKYYSAMRFLEERGKRLDEWESTHEGVLFHCSSGMQAVMLAVGICDEVGVFGFGKTANAKHHYHDDQPVESKIHDYEAEYQLYDDLVENPQVIPFIPDKFEFPTVVVYR